MKDSETHDNKCDPFYAAVFKCITGKSTPESPKKQSFRSRTTSGDPRAARSRTTSEAVQQISALPVSNSVSLQEVLQDHIDPGEYEGLDHVNVSSISMASSAGTVSTSTSTPLNTPKILQEGFATPSPVYGAQPAFLQESPYLGIEETKETVTITADDLIGAVSPTVTRKIKAVAPLKLRKKASLPQLGDALALRSSEQEAGMKEKKRKSAIHDITTVESLKGSLETVPKTPGTPGTPGTPRSPASFFSAVFGKPPTSPDVRSSPVSLGAGDNSSQQKDTEDCSINPTTPEAAPMSPEEATSPKETQLPKADEARSPTSPKGSRSPTLDKVKKIFASSQDLFKQSQGEMALKQLHNSTDSSSIAASPKGMRRSISDLSATGATAPIASPGPSMSARHPSPGRAVSPVPQDLLDEVHRFSFNQYAQTHFASSGRRHTRIFNKKVLPLEQRMKWQAVCISEAVCPCTLY